MPEPIVLKVTRYRCAFCTKAFSKRAATISHMKSCPRDPAQRTCLTCKHDGQWGDRGEQPSCALGVPKVWQEDAAQVAADAFGVSIEPDPPATSLRRTTSGVPRGKPERFSALSC